MGYATEAGTRCSKASCTQFDTRCSSLDAAGDGPGITFGDDERLVLRFLEPFSLCKYRHGGPYVDTLCSECCAGHRARAEDAADIMPCVSGNCISKFRVAVWHEAGIQSVWP